MRGIKYNKIVNKLNFVLKNISERKNILEIGCGSKIYKDIFYQHNYYGLDKHKSEWVFNDDLPEFYCDIKNFSTDLKFDLVFSIATVYLFDELTLNEIASPSNPSGNKISQPPPPIPLPTFVMKVESALIRFARES